jgi:hypothetical protein
MAYWTLPRLGREYYRVEITTDPQITQWEISLDHGVTWVAMEYDNVTNFCSRLVRGPDFVAPGGDTNVSSLVAASVTPYIRAVDNPEVIVRATPRIDLV